MPAPGITRDPSGGVRLGPASSAPVAVRLAASVVALVAALIGAPGPALGATTPFDGCEAELAVDPQGWWTCGCFYRVATETGRRTEAETRLEAHRSADPDNPCLAFALGRLYFEDRDARDAIPLFQQAAEQYRARGLVDGELYARINLAEALSATGAAGDRVTAELDRARTVAEQAGNSTLEATVAVKEAKLLLQRGGDLDMVETSLRQVRRDAFSLAHPSLKRDILLSLGNVLHRRGRFAEAEEVYADLVEVTAGAGLRYPEAVARFNLAVAAGAALPGPGRRERVVRLFDEALEAALEAGHTVVEIKARKRLGRLIGGPEGRAHLQTALDLAEGYRDRAPAVLAEVLAASAMDLLDDDPEEARRRVDEALGLLLAIDDPWTQAFGWADRLRVLWATSPRGEALAAAESTLAIADRLGEIQETEGGRAEVFSVWTEIYQWLAGRLLADAEETGDPEALGRAFEVAERMRARLLLESLSDAGVASTGGPAELDPELEASWRELQRAIVGVHRQLLDPRLAPERRQSLLLELEGLEREEDRLALRRLQAQGSAATRAGDFVGIDELRAGLAPDEALLAFQVGLWRALDGSPGGGAWVTAVTRDDVQVHRVPDRSEIEPVVDLFLHLFDRRDGSEAEPAAALYEALLGEAIESLPPEVERLVLVPDGPLHRLPFAALARAPGAPPLAARYELFVTPSATVWRRLRTLGEGSEPGLVLAVADPTTPGGVPAGELAIAGAERSWTAGVRLAALPYARREGRAALRALGEPGRLLTGPEATERAVKEGAGRGLRVLHLGTHAVLDEAYPQRSAVVLAPGSADQDGLLRPREAAELGLDGAIVVLSACQSASGTVLQGEGALSLARAFLQGGARAVVGSLWPVEDREAADLLDRFYHRLGRGDSVVGALAHAQREAIAAGTPAAVWAGWTVLGDGETVVVPGRRTRGLASVRPRGPLGWAAAVALAVVLALVLVWLAAVVRRVDRRS